MKPQINYVIDILMAIAFIVTAITAFTRSRLHDPAGTIFIILAIIHVLLHWKWIFQMTKNLFTKKTQE